MKNTEEKYLNLTKGDLVIYLITIVVGAIAMTLGYYL